jgi:glycosyltransferase involved in cell wall biosynthesis
MRILWSSNAPWAASGYGQQTALFAPRIKALGHEVAIHAWYGLSGSVLTWEGMPVYPGLDPNAYGQDIQDAHAAHFGADITITLIDAWVMKPDTYNVSHSRWCPWFPIDAEPCPPLIVEKVRQSFAPIVFSKFGHQMMRDVGIDPLYVPHGYDGTMLFPMDRAQARAEMGVPQNAFVVGMVAANKDFPPRKAFPQVLQAFAEFAKDKPDVFLNLHTHAYGGQDLMSLHERLGLKGRVVFADPYVLATGNFIADGSYMRKLYNSFDVLLSPSLGEGFGVPILEAQACGVPVITGGWTAMEEITHIGW